jgi:predicted exporter
MGVLAVVGVGSALWLALRWVPALARDERARPASAFSASLAASLERGVARIAQRRRALLGVALALGVAGLASLPRVAWQGDLRELAALDPVLLAEEESVRRKVSRFDANRFAVVLAESWQEALERNDRLYLALAQQVETGALEGFRSLHASLRSAAHQRANERALRREPELAARLDRVYAEEGFRAGAFEPFAQALSAPPPPPLTLADLRESQLDALVRSHVAEAAGRRAILTYLTGIRDEAAVRGAVEAVGGAAFFDQRRFVREVYGEYRRRTLVVVATGAAAVLGLLWLRYRRLRVALAAFLPSLVVAAVLAGLAAVLGVRVNVMHLIGLVLVMGMGVDYGIFVVDSRARPGDLGATLSSLLLACLTTLFVFGVLSISEHPVLNALGVTTAIGVGLAFCLAPLSLAVLGADPGRST